MDKEELMVGDAVTRDKNNSKSSLYRIIDIKEDILVLLELSSYGSEFPIELHKNQVELITPYPRHMEEWEQEVVTRLVEGNYIDAYLMIQKKLQENIVIEDKRTEGIN